VLCIVTTLGGYKRTTACPGRFIPWETVSGYLLYRLDVAQSRSGRSGEKDNLFPQPKIETHFLFCPARNLVTLPAEPSRLLAHSW
jgi:hypothetical protein